MFFFAVSSRFFDAASMWWFDRWFVFLKKSKNSFVWNVYFLGLLAELEDCLVFGLFLLCWVWEKHCKYLAFWTTQNICLFACFVWAIKRPRFSGAFFVLRERIVWCEWTIILWILFPSPSRPGRIHVSQSWTGRRFYWSCSLLWEHQPCYSTCSQWR